ncbi:MarR family winged helix-turn-helix transcriptional regulator [Rhizosphaericola mali]|uniref:MarR family transcriptional regulator n=1 Tax=Rhizosphaericola mali TaxID=2545455 RepID=A0A5P2FV27_9BACT|nr:MarR family winged helix-turn-helix transcriptional regulator [Rhizosphaericola mali]QES87324.1 MarR family transcriptional regulator [Rhizosphaericola mali]
MKDNIETFRRFNRFYTNVIGLLNKQILNSGYTLIEARILYEISQKENIKALELLELLQMDKGYLSRILKKFEAQKLISRIVSSEDKRVNSLQLTNLGMDEIQKLDFASSSQAEMILRKLSTAEQITLIDAFGQITDLLNKTMTNE